MTDTPQSVHAMFCQETKTEPTYRVHERSYYDFQAYRFTAEDLKLVIRHLQRENRAMNGARYSLRVDKLLDFEYRHFDSLLSEARAKERNRHKIKTAAEKTLQQFRPVVVESPVTEPDTTQTLKDILRRAGG